MRRITLLAAAVASAFVLAAPAAAQGEARMRIVGRAAVDVAPDHVIVRVGVSSKAATPVARPSAPQRATSARFRTAKSPSEMMASKRATIPASSHAPVRRVRNCGCGSDWLVFVLTEDGRGSAID